LPSALCHAQFEWVSVRVPHDETGDGDGGGSGGDETLHVHGHKPAWYGYAQ